MHSGTQNNIGQNWLLLRGLAREAEHWLGFDTKLQARFPKANIFSLDLPGAGQFYQQPCPRTIKEITAITREKALLAGLLSQPVSILALSMGGMVAWEWLNEYPNDLNAVVLVNSSFASLSPFYQRLQWQSYGKIGQILIQTDIYQRELAILKLVSNCREHYEKNSTYWHEIQAKRPVSLRTSLNQIIAAARYTPPIDKPKQPVLLINSRGDRLVSPTCTEAIHKKWQFEVRTHPWAGHDLSLDDSIWLANQVESWANSQL
jgi:pimeloyl-ACP methyl ester carboxylesterase